MKAQPIPPLDVHQFKPRRSQRTLHQHRAHNLLQEIERFLATCSNDEVAEFYAFYETLKAKYHPKYTQQRLPEFLVRRRTRRETNRLLEAVTTLGCRLQFSPNRANARASIDHAFEDFF
jgi:hypothetical protein